MSSHLAVPYEKQYDILGHPAMDFENEEFLIPDSLRDISSSPVENTERRRKGAPECTEASAGAYVGSVST